jgi:hypothetical protein
MFTYLYIYVYIYIHIYILHTRTKDYFLIQNSFDGHVSQELIVGSVKRTLYLNQKWFDLGRE